MESLFWYGIVVFLFLVIIGIWWSRVNNFVLLMLCLANIALFVNAAYHGFGEPLGVRELKKIAAEKPEPSPITKYYSESSRYFATGSDKPATARPKASAPKPPAPTWFWWKVWFWQLAATMLYIPFAFWDEVRGAWRLAAERQEQRRRRYSLHRPQPPTPPQPQPQTQAIGQVQPPAPLQTQRSAPTSFWQGFFRRFSASFSADMAWEFVEAAFRRIFVDRMIMGRK